MMILFCTKYWKNILIRFSVSSHFIFHVILSSFFLNSSHWRSISEKLSERIKIFSFNWFFFLMIKWKYLSLDCLNFIIQFQFQSIVKEIPFSLNLLSHLNNTSRSIIPSILTFYRIKTIALMIIVKGISISPINLID